MTLTVLQIIPNLGAGGAEQACVDVALGLRQRGDRALVVSAGGRRVTGLVDKGVRHFQQPVNTKNPFKIYKNALWLRNIIEEYEIDIVHARSRAPAWSVWLACKKSSCKFVTTFHAAYKFDNVLKRKYNSVMARADRIIAISRFVADYIQTTYKPDRKKINVIYRGLDLEKFTPDNITEPQRATLRRQWDIPVGKRVILLPARLSPIKGQSLLIKVMALMPPEAQDVVAVILGDDQGRAGYRQQLEGMIEGERMDSRIRLVQHCDDMPAAYSLADVVVMPSKVPEGFGRVPVEAMAMGVPVIASALGATSETIVEGETGWLLPPDKTRLWLDKIIAVLNMGQAERAQMAHISHLRVSELFNGQKMVAQTLAVYDDLMRDG